MNKITLSATICVFFSLCLAIDGFSQKRTVSNVNKGVNLSNTNTYIVDYDFQKGKYRINNLKVKVGTPVSFKISNINRLAYSVSVTAKDSVLAETNLSNFPFSDAELSRLLSNSKTTLPTVTSSPASQINTVSAGDIAGSIIDQKKGSGTVSKEEIENKISNISKDIQSIFLSTELSKEISLLETQKNQLKSDSLQLVDSLTKYKASLSMINRADTSTKNNLVLFNLASLENSSTEKIILLQNSLSKLRKSEAPLRERYNNLKQSEYEGLNKFKYDNDRFTAAFEKLRVSYLNSKKAIQLYREVKVVSDNPLLSVAQYRSKYKKDFDTIKVHLPYLKKEAGEFQELYGDVEDLYKNLQYNPLLGEVLNFGGQVKLYAYSNSAKEVADRMNTILKQIDVQSLLDRLDQTISYLEMPDAFNVIFAPIQPLNDAVVFDVKINKRDGNASDLSNNLNFKHQEYTYGGTRIDFSLGLAGSYFNNTPVYELSTKSVDNSSASIISIAQKSNSLSVPSLVGLATMSYRSTRYIAYGASAGLGIDVMNGKVQLSNFYAGPSMIFGKYERLTFTGGATVRNVGQLISGYDVGSVVSGTANKIGNFLSDKYKVGMFLSLSFNLTRGIKDNIKQLKTIL